MNRFNQALLQRFERRCVCQFETATVHKRLIRIQSSLQSNLLSSPKTLSHHKHGLNSVKSSVNSHLHLSKSLPTHFVQLQRRNFWIPPVWLRPLLRPLAVIVASFLGGVILQALQGTPAAKYLLSEAQAAEASAAAGGARPPIMGRVVGTSLILMGLYASRLHNPLYTALVGETETNLQLAEARAALSLQYYWDSRSASDSLVPRLKAMEKYLGLAQMSLQSSDTSESKKKEYYDRINSIRSTGYANAVTVSLARAEHYAAAGELEKFEQTLKQTNEFISEGGAVDEKEMHRVKSVAYGKKCMNLMEEAQTLANKGDVSGCSIAVAKIRNVRETFSDVSVSETDINSVMNRAHSHHLTKMINEARNLKQQGSRRQTQLALERAKNYAQLNNVDFPENVEKEILA